MTDGKWKITCHAPLRRLFSLSRFIERAGRFGVIRRGFARNEVQTVRREVGVILLLRTDIDLNFIHPRV